MLSCEHKNFASKIGNGFFHVHVQSSTSVYTCMSHGNDLRVTTLQYSPVETTSSLLGKLVDLKENLKKNGLKMGP